MEYQNAKTQIESLQRQLDKTMISNKEFEEDVDKMKQQLEMVTSQNLELSALLNNNNNKNSSDTLQNLA